MTFSRKSRLHAVVRGSVQGVNFRAFVQGVSETLGVTGWVRNLGEGNAVEVEAEGEEDKLKLLAERLKIGPRMAQVEDVELEWFPHEGKYTSFRIRY